MTRAFGILHKASVPDEYAFRVDYHIPPDTHHHYGYTQQYAEGGIGYLPDLADGKGLTDASTHSLQGGIPLEECSMFQYLE